MGFHSPDRICAVLSVSVCMHMCVCVCVWVCVCVCVWWDSAPFSPLQSGVSGSLPTAAAPLHRPASLQHTHTHTHTHPRTPMHFSTSPPIVHMYNLLTLAHTYTQTHTQSHTQFSMHAAPPQSGVLWCCVAPASLSLSPKHTHRYTRTHTLLWGVHCQQWS